MTSYHCQGLSCLQRWQIHEWLALNECSLRTMAGHGGEVQINDKFFATFRGDGLCIATPTGSTGLNKSLGGAVMHPRVRCLTVLEMAALNNPGLS